MKSHMCQRFVISVVVIFSSIGSISAQVEMQYIFPEVFDHDRFLDYPFSGGLNSAQYQEIDFDLDNDMDLVIFDRSSESISCYENLGDEYLYNPMFETLFPANIQHWMVLADYNCDGKNDLFTFSNVGIRVFENVSTEQKLQWELTVEPLKTQGTSGEITVLFNATDIPSIADQDGDGDLDFLFFNFSSGDYIEYHKNYSKENSGICDLNLVRESSQYGDIDVCDCDEFEFNGESCHEGARTLHVGGKSILSFDQHQDGDMDLLIGQEDCNELSSILNSGNASLAIFSGLDASIPTLLEAFDLASFPAAYYLDVTFDGRKDLLVSQNLRSSVGEATDFSVSSFLLENRSPNSFDVGKVFLQNEMIDHGESAYPALIDIDGDNLDDLVISNFGSLVDNERISTLAYFKNMGDHFEFQSDDLFSLSNLELSQLKPQFIDLNGDGIVDLAFSGIDKNNSLVFSYLLGNNQVEALSFDTNATNTFDFRLNNSDDFFLYDMDADGHIDLLIGNVFGELDYYHNVGQEFSFQLESSNILGAEQSATNTNLSISIGDVNQDQKDDLITTKRSGQLEVYLDFPNNLSQRQTNLIQWENKSSLSETRLGRKSKPSIGQYAGQTIIAIGTIQGGVRLIESHADTDIDIISFDIFPNPSPDNIFTISTNQFSAVLEIFDLAGNKIYDSINISNQQDHSLNLSHLKRGAYIVRLCTSGNCLSKRILVVDQFGK